MQKINESFTCIGCKATIPPADKTCRNHCPHCFTSQHVDGEIPGDRATSCGGKMLPKEYALANGEIKIHFVCVSCLKEHRNKCAADDEVGELDARIATYKAELERAAQM